MTDAICAFEATLVTTFWYPDQIVADKAFKNDQFTGYLAERQIVFRPVPPG